MTTPRRIVIPSVVIVAYLISCLITLAAADARPAPNDVFTPAPLTPAPPPVQTIIHTGSPMWTFVLVAALSVVLTLVVIFAVTRLRRHNREPSTATL